MIAFLRDNFATLLVLIAIGIYVALSIKSIIKNKKEGKLSCGGCCGSCTGCGSCNACHK